MNFLGENKQVTYNFSFTEEEVEILIQLTGALSKLELAELGLDDDREAITNMNSIFCLTRPFR